MNSLRLSGSVFVDTCSAETTVPWITRMSSSACRTRWANRRTRWGVSEAAATTPPSLISRIRRTMSSSLIDSWYSSCIRLVAFSSGRAAISSNTGSGSS